MMLLRVLFILLCMVAPAFAQDQEEIVIDKSPFEFVYFWIDGEVWEDIQRDAAKYDIPPGKLKVQFDNISKDRSSSSGGFRHAILKWERVTINVAPDMKGMAISYRRVSYFNHPETVILYVPTEADKKRWEETAQDHLRRYGVAFYKAKERMEELAAKAEAETKAREEKLKKPILVYPKVNPVTR